MSKHNIVFLSPATQVRLFRKIALFIGNILFQLDVIIDRSDNCISCTIRRDGKNVFYIDFKTKADVERAEKATNYEEYAAYCTSTEATPTSESDLATLTKEGASIQEAITAIISQIPEGHWQALEHASFTGDNNVTYPVLTRAEVEEERKQHI